MEYSSNRKDNTFLKSLIDSDVGVNFIVFIVIFEKIVNSHFLLICKLENIPTIIFIRSIFYSVLFLTIRKIKQQRKLEEEEIS